MAQTARDFLREALVAVAERARRKVTPQIPSATLRAALNVRIEETLGAMEAVLGVPHYWAIYLHDGRAGITKTNGFLVFFKNPEEDPRIRSGYPERASQIVRLTKAQWLEGLRRNRAFIAAGGDPFDAPMIVVRRVGPTQGSFFFTKGMAGFLEEAGREFGLRFEGYIQDLVREPGMTEKATAEGRL